MCIIIYIYSFVDMTRLSVWVLDGDPGHKNLLHFALNETNYAHTLVILTVSMTQPWFWLEQLNHWIKVLSDHIETLKLEPEEKQEARQRLITSWQSYCEVGDDLDPGSPVKRTMRNNSIDDDDLLPLTEGALLTNLGLDIVVVVTKVILEKTFITKFYINFYYIVNINYVEVEIKYIYHFTYIYCLLKFIA